MRYEHLTGAETRDINQLITGGQLNRGHLPGGNSLVKGWVGLDSMGPMRDSITDALYPGITEALDQFSNTMRKFGLSIVVATNGPDIEGEDILNALDPSVDAFAVTEGGGKAVFRNETGTGQFRRWYLTDRDELNRLKDLEKAIRKSPLIGFMLGDTQPKDGLPPIRTPYETNIVVTLPPRYEVLLDRAREAGFDFQGEIDNVDPSNYVDRILSYTVGVYKRSIAELGMVEQANVIVKKQNRRVYVTPMHDYMGGALSKSSGAELGSIRLLHEKHGSSLGAHELEQEGYFLPNSIYVADNAITTTGEGGLVISPSERSMILGFRPFTLKPDEGVNILRKEELWGNDPENFFFAEVSSRLAVNVTMNGSLPRLDDVERVPILHIGSGLKTLEALTYLYERLHG